MGKRETITAVITAWNEEKNIERCLRSLSWCDRVLIVWMGYDKTGVIARRLGAEVVIRNRSRINDGIKIQENINWGVDHSKTDWILRVDCDEEVTPELRDEILGILGRTGVDPLQGETVAYGIPRNQYFFGGFLKGGDWAYDRLVRFFRRGKARYEIKVHRHEQFTVEGKVGYLAGKLNHYSHPTLASAIDRFNRYAATEVYDFHESRRIALYNLFIQPPYIFLRWMTWHRGFRDGLRGVIAGAYRSWYEFMRWSMYLEYLDSKKKN